MAVLTDFALVVEGLSNLSKSANSPNSPNFLNFLLQFEVPVNNPSNSSNANQDFPLEPVSKSLNKDGSKIEMKKQVEKKADGRTIVFYSFGPVDNAVSALSATQSQEQ